MPEQMNAFQIAQTQFDHVAEQLNLDTGVRSVALAHARVHFPHPGADGRQVVAGIHRLPCPA